MGVQSILTATDFSTDARYAVERAATLGAVLEIQKGIVLHVQEQSWFDGLKDFVGITDKSGFDIVDVAPRLLAELAEEIRLSTDFYLEPHIRTGNALDIIIDAAKGFDLLVVGARGRHPFLTLTLGTTSQRILSKTSRPVLVVKNKPVGPYKRVLVAVDFSKNSRMALEYSHIIAPQAVIYLVHVFEHLLEKTLVYGGASESVVMESRKMSRLKAENDLKRFMQETGVEPHSLIQVLVHGHPSFKVSEIAHEKGADLIIIGKHGRSRIEQFLLGSVTLNVLAQSRCDVLVVEQ